MIAEKLAFFKKKAQSIFLDFFNINENDIRRKREGIYHTSNIINKIKIKIIALDTRYFKDEFKKNYNYNIKKKYLPDYDISKTILGKKQWRWFEKQLKEEYDLLLILSSIQVIPTEHGWEKWFNFPNERNKLLNLINDNKKLTIILSGDDMLVLCINITIILLRLPLVLLIKKSLNSQEQDKYSLGNIVNENNFGFMKINMSKKG